jgi:NADH dehydrogenase
MPAETLGYDDLVLALGAVPHYYGLPGVEEHSFSLKSLGDAIKLRDHVISLLERADAEVDADERKRLLTFVVIGGGFAGTETVAELFDLVRSVFRYYPDIAATDAHFALIHAGERILPELSVDLATYALQKLRARGIDVILKARVAGATADAILLADGSEIPAGTVVWTAGNRPHPLLETLASERNRSGAVVVDGTLRVNGLEDVWAVGDCAEILDPHGRPCPPTAQHAMREGKLAAENVVAALRGKDLRPFRFRPLGVLVALGHRTAVAEVRGWKFSGLLAWFMWRTVYLSKLPGLEKKVRVALDWTIELFFPRDIVLTSAPWTPVRSETSEQRPSEGAL